MTLLYQREGKDADDVPGTHALLIGCGNYPHLLGGKAKLIRRPEGMVASLESPALSVKALTEWLLGTRADGRRFQNPAAPLASVEVLTDNGTFAGSEVEAPTRIAIENAFAQWMDRAKGHPQSVAFFYFCGHGLTGHADYILPSDFGNRPNPWPDAIDVTATLRALRRVVTGPVFFFVDACRQISLELLGSGNLPTSLYDPNLGAKTVGVTNFTSLSTSEGFQAFGMPGECSQYATALMSAVCGDYAEWDPDNKLYAITGEAISRSLTEHFKSKRNSGPTQVPVNDLAGSAVLTYSSTPPQSLLGRLTLWAPSPRIRELVASSIQEGVSPWAIEGLCESLERVQAPEIERSISEWEQHYRAVQHFVNSRTDTPILRALMELGRMNEVKTVIATLSRAAREQLAISSSHLAELEFQRGEVAKLQFDSAEALDAYGKAYELQRANVTYCIRYSQALTDNLDYESAERVAREAVSLCKEAGGEARRASFDEGRALANLGRVLRATGRSYEARDALAEAIKRLKEAGAAAPDADEEHRSVLADTLLNAGVVASRTLEYDEAQRYWISARNMYRELASIKPAKYQARAAGPQINLASQMVKRGEYGAAEYQATAALELLKRPDGSWYEEYYGWIANAYECLYTIHLEHGDLAEAEAALQSLLGVAAKQKLRAPAAALAAEGSALVRLFLLYRSNEPDRARATLEEAIARFADSLERDPYQAAWNEGVAYSFLAEHVAKQGEVATGERLLNEQIEVAKRRRAFHGSQFHEVFVGTSLLSLADFLREWFHSKGQRTDEVLALYREGVATIESARTSFSEQNKMILGNALASLGAVLEASGQTHAAAVAYARAVDEGREVARKDHSRAKSVAQWCDKLVSLQSALGDMPATFEALGKLGKLGKLSRAYERKLKRATSTSLPEDRG